MKKPIRDELRIFPLFPCNQIVGVGCQQCGWTAYAPVKSSYPRLLYVVTRIHIQVRHERLIRKAG